MKMMFPLGALALAAAISVDTGNARAQSATDALPQEAPAVPAPTVPDATDVAPPFDNPLPEQDSLPDQPVNVTPEQPATTAEGVPATEEAADQHPATAPLRENQPLRDRTNAQADANADFDAGFQLSVDSDQPMGISTVTRNSAAARAGLRERDRLISIDGRTFTSADEFYTFAPELAGRRVPIVIERNGQQETLSIDFPAIGNRMRTAGNGWIGVTLVPDYAGDGARIRGVVRNGPAHRAGLRPGDVVTTINRKDIANYADLVYSVQDSDPNSAIQLTVLRNGRQIPITATVASYQRAAYRGAGTTYRYDYDDYTRPSASPESYSGSYDSYDARLDRLENLVLELQNDLRELRSEFSRRTP